MTANKQPPLMPKATAVWLLDNTSLTFQQIAEFCGFHEVEVKAIADGEIFQGIIAVDPILSGQLTQEEIERCSKDPNNRLVPKNTIYQTRHVKEKVSKYIPLARRQDKPDAIYWLLKNVPGLKDSAIVKLVSTTKTTIKSLRERTHWNMSNIRQRDPVLLGICTQTDLDQVILEAQAEAKRIEEERIHKQKINQIENQPGKKLTGN